MFFNFVFVFFRLEISDDFCLIRDNLIIIELRKEEKDVFCCLNVSWKGVKYKVNLYDYEILYIVDNILF